MKLKGTIVAKRLDRVDFEEIITLLYVLELISSGTYSGMMRISDEWTRLIHKVYPHDQYVLDSKKAEKLILEAIKCCEELVPREGQAGTNKKHSA